MLDSENGDQEKCDTKNKSKIYVTKCQADSIGRSMYLATKISSERVNLDKQAFNAS